MTVTGRRRHRPTHPHPPKKPLCPFPPCSKLPAVVFNRKPSGPELPSLLSPVLWLLLRVQALLCRRQPKTPDAPCTEAEALAWLQHMLQAIDDFVQSAKNGTLPPLNPSAPTPPNTRSHHQDSQPAAPASITPSSHHEFPSAAPTPGAAHGNSTPPAEKPTHHPTPPPIPAGKPQRPPANPPPHPRGPSRNPGRGPSYRRANHYGPEENSPNPPHAHACPNRSGTITNTQARRGALWRPTSQRISKRPSSGAGPAG